MISMGAYAQTDSMNNGTYSDTIHNSSGDLPKARDNSDKKMHDQEQQIDSSRSSMRQNSQGHSKDSSATDSRQHNKSKNNMQNQKSAQPAKTTIKSSPPSNQAPVKSDGKNGKDNMYLVPDSAVNKK
jgi:hypothetical protein